MKVSSKFIALAVLAAKTSPYIVSAESRSLRKPSKNAITTPQYTVTLDDLNYLKRKLNEHDPNVSLPLEMEDLTAVLGSMPNPTHHPDDYDIRQGKCIFLLRLADAKTGYVFGYVKHYAEWICGTKRPTLSPTTLAPTTSGPSPSPTVQPTSSPTFVSTISVNVVVVLQDTNTRLLREGVERTLQVNEQCTAALENTFKDLLSTTDATDVAIASITQDEATGKTIVVLTTSIVTSTSEAAVSEAIEGAFSSGTFDNALAANLDGQNCPELEGLTYQSVDTIACAEPNPCSGLNDTTSCGTGEACLVTPNATCPIYQCQETPNPTASPTTDEPTIEPSATPTAPPSTKPTSSPVTGSPSKAPTLGPTLAPITDSPSKTPTQVPTSSPNCANLNDECTLPDDCCEGSGTIYTCKTKANYCWDFNPNNASCSGYPICYVESPGPNPNLLNCSATNECLVDGDCTEGFNPLCLSDYSTSFCTNSTLSDNGGTCIEELYQRGRRLVF